MDTDAEEDMADEDMADEDMPTPTPPGTCQTAADCEGAPCLPVIAGGWMTCQATISEPPSCEPNDECCLSAECTDNPGGACIATNPSAANLATHQVRPSTLEAYRSRLQRHILPRLGKKRLNQITVKDLDELFLEMRQAGHEESYINAIAVTLKSLFRKAEKRGVITKSNLPSLLSLRQVQVGGKGGKTRVLPLPQAASVSDGSDG